MDRCLAEAPEGGIRFTENGAKLVKLQGVREVFCLDQPVGVEARDVEAKVEVAHEERMVEPVDELLWLRPGGFEKIIDVEFVEDLSRVRFSNLETRGMRSEMRGHEEEASRCEMERDADAWTSNRQR
jgi:hypothetical protein